MSQAVNVITLFAILFMPDFPSAEAGCSSSKFIPVTGTNVALQSTNLILSRREVCFFIVGSMCMCWSPPIHIFFLLRTSALGRILPFISFLIFLTSVLCSANSTFHLPTLGFRHLQVCAAKLGLPSRKSSPTIRSQASSSSSFNRDFPTFNCDLSVE